MGFIETIQAYPVISLIAFSLVVSLFITIINHFVLDKEKMRESKKKQKELQKKMKENKHNPEIIAQLNKELIGYVGENFKHSFKPMLITLIPILIFFSWIRGVFAGTSIASVWIWYYIGFSLIFSIIFRKLFKLP